MPKCQHCNNFVIRLGGACIECAEESEVYLERTTGGHSTRTITDSKKNKPNKGFIKGKRGNKKTG